MWAPFTPLEVFSFKCSVSSVIKTALYADWFSRTEMKLKYLRAFLSFSVPGVSQHAALPGESPRAEGTAGLRAGRGARAARRCVRGSRLFQEQSSTNQPPSTRSTNPRDSWAPSTARTGGGLRNECAIIPQKSIKISIIHSRFQLCFEPWTQ